MTSGPVVIGYCSGSSRWKEAGADVKHTITPGLRGLCPVWNQMPANYYQFQRQQTLANYQHRTTIQSQHSRAGLGWIVLEKTRVFRALEVPAAAALNAHRPLWSWNAFSSVHVLTLPTPKGKIWLFSCLMLPYYHQLLVSPCSLVLSRYCTEHFYQKKHQVGWSVGSNLLQLQDATESFTLDLYR